MASSQEYHTHVTRVHRTPSVLTDVPQYPNAYRVLNKKEVVYEEDEGLQHRRHYNPGARERVEVVESEQTTDVVNGNVVYEETVDVEADQYSRRNRGGLNLYKWKTYRE